MYDASCDEYAFVERNMIWSYQIEENVKLLLVGTELWDYEYGEEYNVENSNGWNAELYLDKSFGLLKFCQQYGFTTDEVIAFGDGGNDDVMLEMAGIGVAVKNSKENTKKAADYICKKSIEDGGKNNEIKSRRYM